MITWRDKGFSTMYGYLGEIEAVARVLVLDAAR